MLDNSHMSIFAKNALQYQSYQNRINMFDNNCLGCPYAKIEVKTKDVVEEYSIKEAIDICVFSKESHIIRRCTADSGYSLNEITSNTCTFWYEYKESEDEDWIYED